MSQPYASGFIVVPNDDTGLGGCLISSVTGAISTLTGNVGNGEGGAQLSTGTFAMVHQASTTYSLNIYDTSFSLLHSTVMFTSSDGDTLIAPICSDFQSTFYMMQYNGGSSNVAVRACSSAGVAGTSYTLDVHRDPGLCFMGVSDDNTRLYYGQRGNVGLGNTGKAIKRWDLINNVGLGDFVTSPDVTGRWGEDLIVLPTTDSFIIVYQPDISLQNYQLRRYSTITGSLLSTIALPFDASAGSDPRLSLDVDGPSIAYWCRTFENFGTGTTNFRQYLASSDTQISNLSCPTDSGDPSKVPLSCPFFAWSNNLSPLANLRPPWPLVPPFVAGQGGLETVAQRRLRVAPHLSAEQFQVFYDQFTLDLQVGNGILTGQGVNPQIMLRMSDDGGYTWSDEILLDSGAQGQYLTRVTANGLGQARDRVFEISTSDPVSWSIIGAYLNTRKGRW